MKSVYVLRHANWNQDTGELTNEGIDACVALKGQLPIFKIIISSDFARTKQTAQLLSGEESAIDERASILKMNPAQREKVSNLRDSHPLGVVGALFSIPGLKEEIRMAGKKLVDLVKEILTDLKDDGRALIVSHDGTMVAAKKLLQNESFESVDFTYGELTGFMIDHQMHIQEF